MEAIKLSGDLYARIVDHARTMLPREAVGLLGGYEDGRVTMAIPLPNLAGSRAFLADPLAQFQAERRLAQSGSQLLAIYHTHPGGGTQLSSADLVFAEKRSCIQIVIALEHSQLSGAELRAYQVHGENVTEVEIQIEG